MSTSFSSPTRTGSPTPDARAQPRSPPQPPLSLLWRLRSHASGPGLAATRPPRAGHRRLIQDPARGTGLCYLDTPPWGPTICAAAQSDERVLAYIRHFLAGLKEPAPITSEELGEPMAYDGCVFTDVMLTPSAKPSALLILRALSKSHAGTAQHRTQHLLGVASPCWRKRERRAARGMLDGDGPASFCACISSVVSSRVRIASASKQSL